MASNIIFADYSETSAAFPTHYHDCNQLLFVASGAAEAEIGGKTYRVQAGTLIILSRFEKHSIRVLSADYKRYILRINSKQGNSVLGSTLYSVLINRARGFQNILDCAEQSDAVASQFRAIVDEYRSEHLYKDEMLDSRLHTLLISIARMLPETQTRPDIPLTNTVLQIQMQLEEDYSQSFSLSSLSKQYHVSAYYLSHAFKSITGKSVFQYLFACRLAAAKSYLAQSSLPIAEIVSRCGFSDSSNFSRTFRQAVGLTPTEFRKKYAEC